MPLCELHYYIPLEIVRPYNKEKNTPNTHIVISVVGVVHLLANRRRFKNNNGMNSHTYTHKHTYTLTHAKPYVYMCVKKCSR